MAPIDNLFRSFVTANAVANTQAYYNYVVGESVQLAARQAQAEAFNTLVQSTNYRTYNQTIAVGLLESGARVYAGLSGYDVITSAAVRGSEGVRDIATQISRVYRSQVRNRRDRFIGLYRAVGRQANLAAATAMERRKLGTSAFRSGEGDLRKRRYAGGQLKAALLSDEMFLARPDGLAWLSAAHLDINAPQWYRINFGAGARGSGTPPPKAYNVNFLGTNTGQMGLVGFRTSSPFVLPAGFFSTDGTTANVVPRSRGVRGQAYLLGPQQGLPYQRRAWGPPVVTRGIRGTNYLDEGIKVIARETPLALAVEFRDILRESVASGGTETEFSVKAIDLSDQRRLLKRMDQAITPLLGPALNRPSGRAVLSFRFLQ